MIMYFNLYSFKHLSLVKITTHRQKKSRRIEDALNTKHIQNVELQNVEKKTSNDKTSTVRKRQHDKTLTITKRIITQPRMMC
jgi:hypothetical protein